jgi:hypothetical protein
MGMKQKPSQWKGRGGEGGIRKDVVLKSPTLLVLPGWEAQLGSGTGMEKILYGAERHQ